MAIPVSPTLQAARDSIPLHDAARVLANAQGAAWSWNEVPTAWNRLKTATEGRGLIAPGLDKRRIADLLEQKSPSMAQHYSRSENGADKNRETMARLENANARRARTVKPDPT